MADLSFKRYTQHILVQSSMKVMNHLAPEQFEILDGSQTSEWTKKNGLEDNLLLIGYGTRWCFAMTHTSHGKSLGSRFLNKLGNMFFNKMKGGCPNLRWWSQIEEKLVDVSVEYAIPSLLLFVLGFSPCKMYNPLYSLATPIIFPVSLA